MKRFDDLLEEQLQNEEFCREYEAIQPELDIIRVIADARISQNRSCRKENFVGGHQ